MKWFGALIAVSLAGSAGAQGAQDAERASFYLVSHTAIGTTDTVIVERRTRTKGQLTGELLDRTAGGRVMYSAAIDTNDLITRLTTRSFRTATDTVGETSQFTLGGDTIVVVRGSAAPVHVPGVSGTLAIVNPSVAFIEQMVIRARQMGGDRAQFPILILGAPSIMPLTVSFIGTDSAEVMYAGARMRLAITASGQIVGGVMPAQRISIVRGPALETLAMERRDYSAPAGAPYMAEDVVVHSPSGLSFTGTLTIPRGRPTGRAPAVVTITGSGPEDRDEQSTALKGYRPFRELADTLGRRGIAVLRLDDRGVNGSDRGPATATSRDFAEDIRAGVAYLRSRPEIDADRIALVGHSEGGAIAPMVAESDARLKAIVLMAGTASPGRDILRAQALYAIDSMAHLTGDVREKALAASRHAQDSLAASVPWMRFFFEYDPSIEAKRVKTPVLILQGETDRQVPAREAEKLAAAFRAAGNTSVSVRMFPATNHLFVADPTGGFDYAKLPSLHVRPEVLGAIADWLSTQFN
jgi:alpha-beta hydrolase superfamily lysophospholipase